MQSKAVHEKFAGTKYVYLSSVYSYLIIFSDGNISSDNSLPPIPSISCSSLNISPFRMPPNLSYRIDFCLTVVSVAFNYGGPFFLKSVSPLSYPPDSHMYIISVASSPPSTPQPPTPPLAQQPSSPPSSCSSAPSSKAKPTSSIYGTVVVLRLVCAVNSWRLFMQRL